MSNEARFTGSTSAFATKRLRYADTEAVKNLEAAIACLNEAHRWAGDEADAIEDLITSTSAIIRNITE